MDGENQDSLGNRPYSMNIKNAGFLGRTLDYLERQNIQPCEKGENQIYSVGNGEVEVTKDGLVKISDVGALVFSELFNLLNGGPK